MLSIWEFQDTSRIMRQATELTKWHETKIEEREVSRSGFYIPWTKAEINPVLGNAPKKYAAPVLPTQGRTRSSRDIFSRNREDRNASVLVVQGTSAISRAFIHQMSEVEK